MNAEWTLDANGKYRWRQLGYRVHCQQWNTATNEWDDVGVFKSEADMDESVADLVVKR